MFKAVEPIDVSGNRHVYMREITPEDIRRAVADTPQGLGLSLDDAESVNNRPSEDWDESVGYDGAVKLWREGDKVRLMECDKLARSIRVGSGLGKADKLVWTQDVYGTEVDAGLYNSGVPECCWNPTVKPAPAKAVSVYAEIGNTCNISAAALKGRGVAIGACVRALQLQGYSIAVCMFHIHASGSNIGCQYWTIKRAGETVQPAVLVYWLSRPAAFRRLAFRFIESCPERKEIGLWQGYGHSTDMPEEIKTRLNIGKGSVYLPKGDESDSRIETAMDRLQRRFFNAGYVVDYRIVE